MGFGLYRVQNPADRASDMMNSARSSFAAMGQNRNSQTKENVPGPTAGGAVSAGLGGAVAGAQLGKMYAGWKAPVVAGGAATTGGTATAGGTVAAEGAAAGTTAVEGASVPAAAEAATTAGAGESVAGATAAGSSAGPWGAAIGAGLAIGAYLFG